MNTKNLRINYHIEYICDAKTWDKFIAVTENPVGKYGVEPWELYTNKDFDSFEKALEFYMVYYTGDFCYDIKMWQQIYLDNEMIYEEYCEPSSITRSEMRRIVDKDSYNRMTNYDREIKELSESNNLMNGFIKALGERYENMFKEYVKEKTRG